MNENNPASDQAAEANALIQQKDWLKLANHPYFLHVANQQQLTAVIGKLEQAMSPLPQGLERENHEFAIAFLRSLLKKRAKLPMAEPSRRHDIGQEEYISFLKEELTEVICRFQQEIQDLSQATEREAYESEIARLRSLLSEGTVTQNDRGVYIAALEEQITEAKEGLEDLAAANQHRKLVQETTQVISAETDTALTRLCARYIENVTGYTLRHQVQDCESGNFVEPDERLMRSVEEVGGVSEGEKDEFRRRIVTQSTAVAIDGKRFDDRLYDGLSLAWLSQAENLDRWKASGELRQWVEDNKGRWIHQDWLTLLANLKQSPYWPVDPDAVGAVLKEIKREVQKPSQQSKTIASAPVRTTSGQPSDQAMIEAMTAQFNARKKPPTKPHLAGQKQSSSPDRSSSSPPTPTATRPRLEDAPVITSGPSIEMVPLKDFGLKHLLGFKDSHYYEQKGHMHYVQNQYDKAIECYGKAMQQAAGTWHAFLYYQHRARARMAQGRFQDALADYSEAIRLDSSGFMAARHMPDRIRGDIEATQGRHEQAVRYYSASLEMQLAAIEKQHKRDKAESLNNRAIALLALGRHQEALRDLGEAIEFCPHYKALYSNRAYAYRLLGDEASASSDEEKAIQLEQHQPTPQKPLDVSVIGNILGSLFALVWYWKCPNCGQRKARKTDTSHYEEGQRWQTGYDEHGIRKQMVYSYGIREETYECKECGHIWLEESPYSVPA